MAEVNVEKEVIITGVTVALSLEEARTLRALVGAVTGTTKNSRRKHTDAIWKALTEAGITSYGINPTGFTEFLNEEGL